MAPMDWPTWIGGTYRRSGVTRGEIHDLCAGSLLKYTVFSRTWPSLRAGMSTVSRENVEFGPERTASP